MNVVDSSGWLEYFADGPNAAFFAPAVEDTEKLLVPSVCVAEVFKRVLQQRGEDAALQAVALMRQGILVDLDFSLALSVAKLGFESKLPLADSIVFATARLHDATLYTQDSDFEGMENVRFVRRKR